ncbi:MAG: 2-octaprenyl-6-methoxyphenyl hydroxylase [Pseudomonadota bacterium]
MKARYDVVVVGGGMVGASLALQLATTFAESLSICLVEGFSLPDQAGSNDQDYHPSFDARSTALSYSSRIIYERLGVWSRLEKWLCPIESIHVSSRGHFGSSLLQASDHNWPALGYVVENTWLGNILLQRLRSMDSITLLSPARVVSATAQTDGMRLRVEGGPQETIETALLVVADGAGSSLRAALGMQVQHTPYEQHALIANVSHALKHSNCAFERFTDQGPLAFLPLWQSKSGENRSALVWTVPPEQAVYLQAAGELEFLQTLQDRFGYRLGRMLGVGERHSYPLSLVQSQEQVRQGVVVMGNAAHALHPVAGQGFNLALRDVAQLSTVLKEGVEFGSQLGDISLLQHYLTLQQADQSRTIEFSDRVPALFMLTDPVLGLTRDMALSSLDILPPLKRLFVRHAAGMAAMPRALDALKPGAQHG